jgi:hypothetical protein
MSEVSMQEISLQDADLLTAREALSTCQNVDATNLALAFAKHGGHATAAAIQTISVRN